MPVRDASPRDQRRLLRVLGALVAALAVVVVALAARLAAVVPAGPCAPTPSVSEDAAADAAGSDFPCPPPWLAFGDRCFHFSERPSDRHAAAAACRAAGAGLAVLADLPSMVSGSADG